LISLSNKYSARFVQHRKAKALSQEALAEKANLHPTYIGLMERGLRNPSLNVSKSLAKALNTSLTELIAEAEALQSSTKR
jgi:transcriptional regulator with XRE-family HTH domain